MIKINILLKFFIVSFIITLFLLVVGISIFKKINFRQYVRKLGPKSHLKKQGTPTMGGIYIIIGTTISFLYFVISSKIDIYTTFMFLSPLLLYGLIGFIDDYKKIREKKNDGISAKLKIILQICFGAIYFFIFLRMSNTTIFIFKIKINISYLYGVLILLMFIATSNAYNISDGMDGLAGGLGIIIFCGLLFITNTLSSQIFIMSIIGAITAFLCYNIKPAKVFMGDVGSMGIGVSISNLFIILKCEILLFVFGFVLIIESLSVIIQVTYFKITKGKRVFLMSPIHHHFELKGLKDSRVVTLFWIIELIFVIIGIYLYKKYY